MIRNAYLSATALAAGMLFLSPIATAQDLSSNSNSGSAANSGSVSGAEANGTNSQTQSANNAGIGNSTSGSSSNAGANSGSTSASTSNGNMQGQNQGQSANNSQGQTQGQTTNQSLGVSATQGQTASNSQGVSVTNQFNSSQLKRTYVGTNTAVPLAASSSFSSDYCGGTVSGGASAAPIGISIGASGPTFDRSCQSLRRAEKFGMAAANYQNMGQPEEAMKLMSLMVWSICTADSAGPKADRATAEACAQILQMGPRSAPLDAYPVPPAPSITPAPPVTPLESAKPNITPAPNDQDYSNLPPKQPRGDAGTPPPIAIAP